MKTGVLVKIQRNLWAGRARYLYVVFIEPIGWIGSYPHGAVARGVWSTVSAQRSTGTPYCTWSDTDASPGSAHSDWWMGRGRYETGCTETQINKNAQEVVHFP